MDHAVTILTVGNALSTQRYEEYPMKKKLLSLAIAGASLVAAHSYAAGPTVYGKLNVSLQKIDTEIPGATDAVTGEDTWKLMSNASRLGVMGDLDINSSLKAIYKLEYEVAVDDGANDSGGREFAQRNIYVGLQGKNWGTLIAGKNDTPLKMAQGTVDEFNDYYLGDIKYLMVGEDRASNIIMYSTPNMGGLTITAAIMPGEQTNDDSVAATGFSKGPDATKGEDDGVADYVSAAIEYKMDALRLAAAYNGDVNNNDVIRLVGEYTASQFQLGALYESSESHDSDTKLADDPTNTTAFYVFNFSTLGGDSDQDAFIVSGAFKVDDKVKLKAQVGQSETKFKVKGGSSAKLETQEIAVGADYALAATTTLFAYYSQISWDAKALDQDSNGKTFAVGIDQKF